MAVLVASCAWFWEIPRSTGKVADREGIAPYPGNRDLWYTQVVKDDLLAKHHVTLLIMNSARVPAVLAVSSCHLRRPHALPAPPRNLGAPCRRVSLASGGPDSCSLRSLRLRSDCGGGMNGLESTLTPVFRGGSDA